MSETCSTQDEVQYSLVQEKSGPKNVWLCWQMQLLASKQCLTIMMDRNGTTSGQIITS
jgi:hypothetical protein